MLAAPVEQPARDEQEVVVDDVAAGHPMDLISASGGCSQKRRC